MHAANHPGTKHVLEDVWRADLKKLVGGRKVGGLWLSPDCKHFSRAKGGKPVEKSIQSLAWIAVKWATEIKPEIIFLENVREFADWGPLVPRLSCSECGWFGTEGQATLVRTRRRCPRCESRKLRDTGEQVPCPQRKGLTFRRFVGRLRNLGYKVEWRNLDAADFGAPTHRKRLFMIARRDGKPIIWPEPTHCDPKKLDDMPLFGRLEPYRTAAECIDWDIPCPSIFGRKKPLAEQTLRRIALGIKRYVIDNPKPFIVRIGHTHGKGNYSYGTEQPLTTVTTKGEHLLVNPVFVGVGGATGAGRPKDTNAPSSTVMPHDRRAVVTPIVAPIVAGVGGRAGQSPATSGGAPIGTVTAKADRAIVTPIVAPLVAQTSHTGSTGRGKYVWAGDEPVRTLTGASEHAVLTPILSKYHGQKGNESRCAEPDEPITTLDTQPRFAVVSPTVVQVAHGDSGGRREKDVEEPLGSLTATNSHAVAIAQMIRHYGDGGSVGREVDRPAPTAVGRETQNQLMTAYVAKHFGGMVGVPAETPLPTTTSKGCQNQVVAATLVQTGYGEREGQAPRALDVEKPLGTVVSGGTKHAAVAATLVRENFDDAGVDIERPAPTVTTNNHAKLVYAFLSKYFPGAFDDDGVGVRVEFDCDGSAGSAARWDGVATGAADQRGNARPDRGQAGGVSQQERVSEGQHSHGQQGQAGVGTPAGVHGSQGANTKGSRRKSQGRQQGEQPSGQLGATDAVGESSARVQNGIEGAQRSKDQRDQAGGGACSAGKGAAVQQGGGGGGHKPGDGSSSVQFGLLTKYYGTAVGSDVEEPMPTATAKGRFGLVTVTIDGEPYVVVDIGMRMLTPRELARAQGFPEDYILTGTKTSQVARIGNSVCPAMAKALVEANYLLEPAMA